MKEAAKCIAIIVFGVGFLLSLVGIAIFMFTGKDATTLCWIAFWCGLVVFLGGNI